MSEVGFPISDDSHALPCRSSVEVVGQMVRASVSWKAWADMWAELARFLLPRVQNVQTFQVYAGGIDDTYGWRCGAQTIGGIIPKSSGD